MDHKENQTKKTKVRSNKTIIGVIASSLMLATAAIMFNTSQKPLNIRSHKLQVAILHCAATPEGRDTKAIQLADYFMRPKAKGGMGWKKPGYNDVIELDGTVVNLVPYNEDSTVSWTEVSYGAGELNGIAVNICYVGGCDRKMRPKNTLTPAQESSMKDYLFAFIRAHPYAVIAGHNQFVAKACPSFDVPTKLRSWGIPEGNIYDPKKFNKNNEKVIRNTVNRAVVSTDI